MKSFRILTLGAALFLSFALSANAQSEDLTQSTSLVEQSQLFEEQGVVGDSGLSLDSIQAFGGDFTLIGHRDRDRNRGDRDRDRGGRDDDRGRDGDRWDRDRDRDRGGHGRYEWVFEYVDGSGRCNSCSASCGERCDQFNLGAKMACDKHGTHNDLNVFRCTQVGR